MFVERRSWIGLGIAEQQLRAGTSMCLERSNSKAKLERSNQNTSHPTRPRCIEEFRCVFFVLWCGVARHDLSPSRGSPQPPLALAQRPCHCIPLPPCSTGP